MDVYLNFVQNKLHILSDFHNAHPSIQIAKQIFNRNDSLFFLRQDTNRVYGICGSVWRYISNTAVSFGLSAVFTGWDWGTGFRKKKK